MDLGTTNAASIAPVLRKLAETDSGRSKLSQIATRIALHGLALFPARSQEPEFDQLLYLFRGVSLAWAVGKYEGQISELKRLTTSIGIEGLFNGAQFSLFPALRNDDAAISAILASTYTAIYSVSENPTDVASRLAHDHAMILPVAGAIRPIELDWKAIELEESVLDQPLWNGLSNAGTAARWLKLKENLLQHDTRWEVWTDWYDARLRGGPTHPDLSTAVNERIEVARVLEIQEKDWKEGSANVNDKIKTIIERERKRDSVEQRDDKHVTVPSEGLLNDPPPEPNPGPGPSYSIKAGQLHLESSPPVPGDEGTSAALLPFLREAASDLQRLFLSLGNSHPKLASAVNNYVTTLDAPFEELNIHGVWVYGGILAELKQSFETQPPTAMTEALEPEVEGILASVVRQHAAFILGTEQGRELIERADRFQQAPEIIEEAREPASEILDELSDNENLVDEVTRAAHNPVRDHLRTIEWGACRTSYAGYLIVRKATFAILRVVVGTDVSLISILGAATAIGTVAGDPSLDFLRIAIPILRDHAAAILAIYKHSPELRSYAEYAISMIEVAEEKLDSHIISKDEDR